MFEKILREAFDSGKEIIICTRYMGDFIQGRIQDIDDEKFSIFHSCPRCAKLWYFPLADVVTVGLPVDPPQELSLENASSLNSDDEIYTERKEGDNPGAVK